MIMKSLQLFFGKQKEHILRILSEDTDITSTISTIALNAYNLWHSIVSQTNELDNIIKRSTLIMLIDS